jgi:NodT family efflux transporter outer membrane factor (OMF) lipoprotein
MNRTNNWRGSKKYLPCAALAACIVVLSGCMVGPKYSRPAAPVPQAYKEPLPNGYKEWKPAQPNEAALRGKWWEIYNDPDLNALEEQVSISNQNIIAAAAQFREARDLVLSARSNLFPTVGVGTSIVNSRQSQTIYGSGNSNNAIASIVQQRTTYALPISISWEADIWGSIRHTVNANVADTQSSAALLANARLSYQALLAQDYFALHGIDAEADILERTYKSYQDSLQLTKDRYEAGVASDLDVAQAETQLNTAKAQLVDLGVNRAQYEHAIAVLMGKPPSELSIPKKILATPPPAIPVSVPSELLERRPDIASAERLMAAQNELIGVAQAAYYPTVGLSATTGLQTSDFTKWFTWPSKYWSVGPTASETIFDAGRRNAQLRQERDAYDATVASYRQTVLTAFQQVEDNLSALRILGQELETQNMAVNSAQRALDVSTEEYKAGTVDYLTVLTAQNAVLSNQLTASNLLTRQMTSSVLLVEALGGGWNSADLPARESIVSGQ